MTPKLIKELLSLYDLTINKNDFILKCKNEFTFDVRGNILDLDLIWELIDHTVDLKGTYFSGDD